MEAYILQPHYLLKSYFLPLWGTLHRHRSHTGWLGHGLTTFQQAKRKSSTIASTTFLLTGLPVCAHCKKFQNKRGPLCGPQIYMSYVLIINSLSTSTCKLIDGSVENLHFGELLTVRINELKLVCPKLNVHNHWKVVTRTLCICVHMRVLLLLLL